MSHVKAGGTAKNVHNNAGQRLGVKRFGGQKVKAKFVFTDAEDYPIFETEGFGYMGEKGAPYWFERIE